MNERDANRYEELQIDSALFELNQDDRQELEEKSDWSDPFSYSFEAIAGLVEMTATEIQSMPSKLQQSILESGHKFIQQNRNN